MAWADTLDEIAIVLDHDPDPPEEALLGVLELAVLAAGQLVTPRSEPVPLQASIAALYVSAARVTLGLLPPAEHFQRIADVDDADLDESAAHLTVALHALLTALNRAIWRGHAQPDNECPAGWRQAADQLEKAATALAAQLDAEPTGGAPWT